MDLYEKEVISTLSAFSKYKVRYLLVGGFAVNYYGYNRTTADLDLWIDTSEKNKSCLVSALDYLGFDTDEISAVELKGKAPIDIPMPGFKIELINYLGDLIDFEDAYHFARDFKMEGIPMKVLHINHLIQMKESSNRTKDLLDVEELKKIRDRD